MGLIDAEAITNVHRGGASGITNVLPSWDPRGGPPDVPEVRKPGILWRAPMEEREPLLALSGDRILVTTDERNIAILDSDGKVAFTYELRGRISSVAGGPDGFLVSYGEEIGFLEKDGQWKLSSRLEANLKSLAFLPDGTVLAGSDPYYGGKMYIIDPEGKPSGEVDAPFSGNITPMADGRLAALDGRRRPGILEAGGAVQLSTLVAGAQGLAVSGDSKRLFLLEDSQHVSCYTLEKTRVPTKDELSYPDMPNVPLLERLWEARLPDSPKCLAHLPEKGVLASSVRLGFLYLHSESGRLLWKGRFKGDSITALAAFPGGTLLLVATEEPALYCVDLSPVLG
jgi:hypothetical protein